mgnify:CR=1 FL=1
MKSSNIGGQAVLEGIMMRNGGRYSVAVRKPDGDIEVDIRQYKSIIPWKTPLKIPFIRGIFNFVDSLVLGMKTLTFSASFFEEEEEELLTEAEAKKREKNEKIMMNLTVVLSVIIAAGLFMVLPYYLSGLVKHYTDSRMVMTVCEGLIRVGLFLLYIALISRMKDIQRTFMYHGAEHKCINCIEDGKELNVANVRTSSRLHRRCGTSFLFLVMFISIVAFILVSALMPADAGKLFKIVVRLLLIPVIAGISYEVLRLAGKNDSLIVRMISAPGMALQKLTTKEPDDSMIEVAISAVEAVFDWKQYLREQGIEVADKEEENNAVKDM